MVKIGPRFVPRRWSNPQAPPPKLALLIGIDYVDAPLNSDWPPLRRARSDTKDFRDLLITKYDYRPEDIIVMLDGDETDMHLQPSRANILREIRRLVHGAQDGSRFVFFFSGHSGQIESPNNDEDDGLDEFLVPVDHSQHSGIGDTRKRMILDNKLRKMLVDPLPVGASLTAIFDSCHSGTMLDLDHYLCNKVYYPWQDLGFRRHMTKWLGVRRKDGQREFPLRRKDVQRMSQSSVRVVTTKHAHGDKKPKDQSRKPGSTSASAASSGAPTRENSACSVRIYQRKRLSDKEMGIFDTSVGVTNSEDGQRSFSVQSRRASVSCKPSLSLAQVMEGAQSMDSLDEEPNFGPRCTSPTSIRTCTGFCEAEDKPPGSGTILSISSCQDSQRTWESKNSSFTQWLIELLRLDPHQPIGQFLQELTHKMYQHAQKTHEYSYRIKDRYRHEHPDEASGSSTTIANGSTGDFKESSEDPEHLQETPLHLLDTYDYTDIPEPQLGAQHRIDLDQPITL